MQKMSTANSTTTMAKDAATILLTSNASISSVTSIASTYTVTSSASTSTGTSITSISTIASDASNGSMTSSASASSVAYVTFTGTVSLSSSYKTVTSDPYTSYVTTKSFTSVESFNSSISNITTNPSTNAETSNVLNTTMTSNVSTSTVSFYATNASSTHPSNLTSYRTTLYLDSTNTTSSKPFSSANYLNDNSKLTIALSVSLSVIFLVICIAVISMLYRNSRRKRLSLERAPVRIEVPDIFVRLSNELVSHRCEQHISQSPTVLGMEEIKRLSSLSIINSRIPNKKADNLVTVIPKLETIATIDITDHTSQTTENSRRKGVNRAFVPEIALVQLTKRSGNTGEFHKQEYKEDGVSQTVKLETSKNTEDETFTEIRL